MKDTYYHFTFLVYKNAADVKGWKETAIVTAGYGYMAAELEARRVVERRLETNLCEFHEVHVQSFHISTSPS